MEKLICNNILIGYILGLSWGHSINNENLEDWWGRLKKKTSWWLQNVYYFTYSVRLIILILYFLSNASFYATDCTSISSGPFSTNFPFIHVVFSQTGTIACFGSGHLHSPSGTRYLSVSRDPLVRGVLLDCSAEKSFGRAVSFLLPLPMPGATGCA